jgi:hypothetical protein
MYRQLGILGMRALSSSGNPASALALKGQDKRRRFHLDSKLSTAECAM